MKAPERASDDLPSLAREVAPGLPSELLELLYVPLFRLLRARVRRGASTDATRGVSLPRTEVVALSGLPGTGKSTLARTLGALLGHVGVRSCGFSLDDVYLTRAERGALAATVHPLLAQRGVPGTHDLDLAFRTLDALLQANDASAVSLPRFDKLLDDRTPVESWPVFRGRLGSLFWMVGFGAPCPRSKPRSRLP